ncbi:hypothetical protein GCM10010298_16950 [Streptomyces microflavus]|uniref:Uncharacterized protein n=1 Tax=Streptomyces microflavus TaxID=1919 RepID=A0A7J0CUV8_STRMI|nr:hypothetical protein Smic_41230 [Streptomyces microflavus]GGX53590.1 hypothetical protein GCM10010298_16950 [Streptomyces microflavus]
MLRQAFLGVSTPRAVSEGSPLVRSGDRALRPARKPGARGREFLTRPAGGGGRAHSGGTAPESHRASSPVAVWRWRPERTTACILSGGGGGGAGGGGAVVITVCGAVG